MLEELTVVVAIAPRWLDHRRRLEVQHALLRPLVRLQPPRRADGQDEVVPRAVAERSEDRVADAGALMDEEHLVGDAVAVERSVRHRLGRTHDTEHDIVVEVEGTSARDDVAARVDTAGLGQSMAMEPVVGGFQPDVADGFDPVRPGRWRQVVEQRAATGEALHAEELFRVQRSIRCSVLRVALLRDAAPADVVHRMLDPPSTSYASGGAARTERKGMTRSPRRK